jgi:hypothetical protein
LQLAETPENIKPLPQKHNASLYKKLDMLGSKGIEGKRAAGGSFNNVESAPSMGGLTEQASGSEDCDNQTERGYGL